MTELCLFSVIDSNAGVFAHMFNQLTQDKTIDRISYEYEKLPFGGSWSATIHIRVCVSGQSFILYGPLRISKRLAKRAVIVKASHLLPHLSSNSKTNITFKKRPVALINTKGVVSLC